MTKRTYHRNLKVTTMNTEAIADVANTICHLNLVEMLKVKTLVDERIYILKVREEKLKKIKEKF